MCILHQFELMTSNGFSILLILVERIEIDIAQNLRKDFNESSVGFERTKELI